jgi:hypothetical protein
MDWLDAHAGSVQALVTVVLVLITAYYAWVSRLLVRETHATLQATVRTTLQDRLDRVSALLAGEPELFEGLADPTATGEETDGRFHVTNMLMAVLEEAYTQYALEHTMPLEDWEAWVATTDRLLSYHYLRAYWRHTRLTFGASFRAFVDERIRRLEPAGATGSA